MISVSPTNFSLSLTDLHLHFQPARSEERLVDHILSIRHSDEEDVVELFHPVHLGQQLIHHSVVNALGGKG